MKIDEWVDIPALKLQSKHTSAVLGTLLSLFIITHVSGLLLGSTGVVRYLPPIDDFLTVVAIAIYGMQLLYHLIKGGGGGRASIVLVA